METGHTFAMELASGPTGTARVWDYVGDNFVHRLVMNKPDGKPVEVGEGGMLALNSGGEQPTQPYNQEDKLEAVTLEVLLQLCLSSYFSTIVEKYADTTPILYNTTLLLLSFTNTYSTLLLQFIYSYNAL